MAIITININDVSRDLPGYLPRLHAGETVLIVQNNKPVAELKPLPAAPSKEALRPFGFCAGEFVVPGDFDAPLPDALLAEFEGERNCCLIRTSFCGTSAVTRALRLHGRRYCATRPIRIRLSSICSVFAAVCDDVPAQ